MRKTSPLDGNGRCFTLDLTKNSNSMNRNQLSDPPNRRNRWAVIAAVVGLAICIFLVCSLGPVILQQRGVSRFLRTVDPVGGLPVYVFDLSTITETDPCNRLLAIATALAGVLMVAICGRSFSFSAKLLSAFLVAIAVAYSMPRPLYGTSFEYLFFFFLIQSLTIIGLTTVMHPSPGERKADRWRFSLADLLCATLVVAFFLMPPVRNYFTFSQWHPHPPTQISVPLNLWLIFLAIVAAMNSVAWTSANSAPVRWRVVLLPMCFGLAVLLGQSASWLYRETEIFWPPNRVMGRHPWPQLYVGYMYWFCWQGVFIVAITSCWPLLLEAIRYRLRRGGFFSIFFERLLRRCPDSLRIAEPSDATERRRGRFGNG